MRHLLAFKVLDEVCGEEAFPDAALAVDDEINLFLHVQMVLGSAIRGPFACVRCSVFCGEALRLRACCIAGSLVSCFVPFGVAALRTRL